MPEKKTHYPQIPLKIVERIAEQETDPEKNGNLDPTIGEANKMKRPLRRATSRPRGRNS